MTGSMLAAACLTLSGCQTVSRAWDSAAKWTPTFLHPYRPDVYQGNLITSEMVGQLEKGMSKEQVQFLLGLPLLQDRFHTDRWNYVYYVNRRSGETETRKLIVYFNAAGRVDHWEADKMPDETEADLMILGDKKAEEAEAAKKAAPAASTAAPAPAASAPAASAPAAQTKKE